MLLTLEIDLEIAENFTAAVGLLSYYTFQGHSKTSIALLLDLFPA